MIGNQVLLVDDDMLSRTLVGDMVREAGCEPVLASNATEAIGALADLQPIAAFIDLHMPDSPGDECCKVIKSSEELSEVPVVLMTSANTEEEVQRAFLAGADDFLPKPVRAYQLTAKLKAIRDGFTRPKQARRGSPVKRVLLADDDGFFRNLIGNLLERAGYEVVHAETGLSALRMMLRGRPKVDLCILNPVMPGMDGITLLRNIRAHPELSKFPMIVVSGFSYPPEELQSVGIVAALRKDALNLEDLLNKVNAELYRGQETRILRRVRFYRVCDFHNSGSSDWHSGFIYNLSAAGVGLRTLTAPPAGALVDIQFQLTQQIKLEAKAKVVWANEFNPGDAGSFPFGMGLQWTEIGNESQEWINAFLKT